MPSWRPLAAERADELQAERIERARAEETAVAAEADELLFALAEGLPDPKDDPLRAADLALKEAQAESWRQEAARAAAAAERERAQADEIRKRTEREQKASGGPTFTDAVSEALHRRR